MIEYKSSVINDVAARLYRQADAIMFVCCAFGFVLFSTSGAVLARPVGHAFGYVVDPFLPCLSGAFVGSALGYFVGDALALATRCRAQVLLCQVQIEAHTNHTWTLLAGLTEQTTLAENAGRARTPTADEQPIDVCVGNGQVEGAV